jgi:electron transfer flavoprotein beta subunit
LISLDSENQTISVSRRINGIKEIVQTKSPIVLTIDKEFGEPRYPSFIGLQKASKYQIIEYTLEKIDFIAPSLGLKFLNVEPHELGKTHCEFIKGNNPEEIANNLIGILKLRDVL